MRRNITINQFDCGISRDQRKRPFLAHCLGLDAYWLPVPRQEFVEAAGGMTVGHTLQDVSKPGKGLDVVELCGGDEGADGCPSDAAAVRACEQMVFAPERNGPDGAFDRIVVEFDAAVREESGECGPARERITNGLGERAGGWNAAKLHLEPRLHHLDERPGAGITGVQTCSCRTALDRSLNCVEFGRPP